MCTRTEGNLVEVSTDPNLPSERRPHDVEVGVVGGRGQNRTQHKCLDAGGRGHGPHCVRGRVRTGKVI